MTTIYAQFTPSDKKRVLKATISRVISRHPSSRKLLHGILKLVKTNDASKKASWQALKAHVGRDVIVHCATLAMDDIETQMMKERDDLDKDTTTVLCNGCLSFHAQLKCRCCDKVRFCIGCAEYGKCGKCEYA